MNAAPRPPIQVGPIHYQILAAGGLVLVFLAQLEQGLLLGSLLVACVGAFGILSKTRAAPLLLLFAFAAAQIAHYRMLFGTFDIQDDRPMLQLRDLVLAIGLVAYVAAHCRLQSLWLHILPADPRQRQEQPRRAGRWWRRQSVPVEQKRASRLLTPHEIAVFVLALPLYALAGQALWIIIGQPWGMAVFPPRFLRLVTLIWLLVITLLVVAALLVQWRRRQLSQAAAQVCLQDVLWQETRREQRRIFRWLAWRKLHETADSDPTKYELAFQWRAMSMVWIMLGILTSIAGILRIIHSISLIGGGLDAYRFGVIVANLIAVTISFSLSAFFFSRSFVWVPVSKHSQRDSRD